MSEEYKTTNDDGTFKCPTLEELTKKELYFKPKFTKDDDFITELEDNDIDTQKYWTEESNQQYEKIASDKDAHIASCDHPCCKQIMINRNKDK